MRHSARPPGVEMPIGKHLSGSIKIRGVKRRNRPLSESRTGVRGRRLDVRDVDVSYFDPTDFGASCRLGSRSRSTADCRAPSVLGWCSGRAGRRAPASLVFAASRRCVPGPSAGGCAAAQSPISRPAPALLRAATVTVRAGTRAQRDDARSHAVARLPEPAHDVTPGSHPARDDPELGLASPDRALAGDEDLLARVPFALDIVVVARDSGAHGCEVCAQGGAKGRERKAQHHQAVLPRVVLRPEGSTKMCPDYVASSSCSIDRVDCAVGSVQRAPNRSEWAARRHVSGPNPVPVPVWSLEHEIRT